MKDIAPLLEELAAQLGTTVDYLWPHMVLWCRLEWLGGFIASVVVLVVGLYMLKRSRAAMSAAKNACSGHGSFDIICDAPGPLSYIVVAFCVIFGGSFALVIHGATVANFLVPEARVIGILLSYVGG